MDEEKYLKFEDFFGYESENLLSVKSYKDLKKLESWQSLSLFETVELVCMFHQLAKAFLPKEYCDKILKNIGSLLTLKMFVFEDFVDKSKVEILNYIKTTSSKNEFINYLVNYRNEYLKLQLKYNLDEPYLEFKSLPTFINEQIKFANILFNEKNNPEEEKIKVVVNTFESSYSKDQLKSILLFLKNNQYIAMDTDETSFINIFQNVPIVEVRANICWIDKTSNELQINKHSLFCCLYMITSNKSNGLIQHPYRNLILSTLFQNEKGEKYTSDQIKSSFSDWNKNFHKNNTKNNRITLLLDYFNTL